MGLHRNPVKTGFAALPETRPPFVTQGMPANALSRALGVPVNRVTTILNGRRGVARTRRFDWRDIPVRRRNSG